MTTTTTASAKRPCSVFGVPVVLHSAASATCTHADVEPTQMQRSEDERLASN